MTSEHEQGQNELERKISAVGAGLMGSMAAVLDELPGAPLRSKDLATTLSVGAALTSRLLQSLRDSNPIAAVHHAPGPAPLGRMLRSAAKLGVSAVVIEAAESANEAFGRLIREEAGNRNALNAMLVSMLPGTRAEFELRRKQSAFKALSELRGASADVTLAAFILSPSEQADKIDVVVVMGLLGLRRWRPDVTVKIDTRRFDQHGAPRRPTSLGGTPVSGLGDLRLDEFCTAPPSLLEERHTGKVGHYLIGGPGFGPNSQVDHICAEANFGAMTYYAAPDFGHKNGTIAQTPVPSKLLVHDVFVHPDLFAGQAPEFHITDTSQEGAADFNDPSFEIDRMDMCESLQHMGTGTGRFHAGEVPRYVDLLRHVFAGVGWQAEDFRGHRARVEYPLYCSQSAIFFNGPAR